MSESFETMPAGRALDAEVAKALGWTDLHVEANGTCYVGFAPSPPKGGTRFVHPYSTNTCAAWDLVEMIAEIQISKSGDQFRLDIGEFTDDWTITTEPTAALAITRAFLLHRAKQVKR